MNWGLTYVVSQNETCHCKRVPVKTTGHFYTEQLSKLLSLGNSWIAFKAGWGSRTPPIGYDFLASFRGFLGFLCQPVFPWFLSKVLLVPLVPRVRLLALALSSFCLLMLLLFT